MGKCLLEGFFTTWQGVGQPGREGSSLSPSLLPAPKNLSCFPKPSKTGNRRSLFCQPVLHTVQVTSLHVPKCFSTAPTAKSQKTTQTKGQITKVPTPGKPEVSGAGGFFFSGSRSKRTTIDFLLIRDFKGEFKEFQHKTLRGLEWVHIMLHLSGNKELAIGNTSTKIHP